MQTVFKCLKHSGAASHLPARKDGMSVSSMMFTKGAERRDKRADCHGDCSGKSEHINDIMG